LPDAIGMTVATTTRPAEPATPTTRPADAATIAAVIPPAVLVSPPSPPAAASPDAPKTPAGSAAPAGPGGGGRPGPNTPAADPAPLSDRESDPFARVGSVTVRAGKVDARLGRDSKLIKPRLTTKAQLDLITILDPSVIMKVAIDPAGKVTDVDVLKSSGSNEIDLPAKLALYKSWIEPAKDKTGKPVPDVMILRFHWK
jgi:protein TonB